MPTFKEAEQLENLNDEKIKAFYKLPFWKRWGKHALLKEEIMDSWRILEINNPVSPSKISINK